MARRHPLLDTLPKRGFRRNQLKNLARRKGYRLVREYTRYAGWIYRIIALPWPSMRGRIKEFAYCKTEVATAAERVYVHIVNRPDATYRTLYGRPV